jgi:hypothetical protein
MLTFGQWIMEARYEPEEQYSWVWHPQHGSHSERGYMQHRAIFNQYPELHKLTHHETGEDKEHDYDAPRGFARVDRPGKTVHYTRYDQSKFGVKGSSDSADAKEVDSHIRKHYSIPSHFKSVMHDAPKWWHNTQGFEFKSR